MVVTEELGIRTYRWTIVAFIQGVWDRIRVGYGGTHADGPWGRDGSSTR